MPRRKPAKPAVNEIDDFLSHVQRGLRIPLAGAPPLGGTGSAPGLGARTSLSISIREATLNRIQRLAEETGHKRSPIIDSLLTEALDQRERRRKEKMEAALRGGESRG